MKERWIVALRRVVQSASMQRLQERLWGCSQTRWSAAAAANSGSVIWLLGVCYKVPAVAEGGDKSVAEKALSEFLEDFSSRLWLTYRRGFEALGESKITSDVGWGCMVRSGQMLVAQALICHRLGRSWRRDSLKQASQDYVEIVESFGDSFAESCPFSIHNILEVGRPHGLTVGSWMGPYALCRALEALGHADRERCRTGQGKRALPMAIYVVSGEAEGARGGAPVLCIDDAADICCAEPGTEWAPLLVLVPLVLGLDKVNPLYLPSLQATFGFPQSLGVLGGKPGASTYIVGVQDDQVLYLDPHEVQLTVKIDPSVPDADTSSYHCGVVRRMRLDAIDPSLALGFYCRNKEEFDDLCSRASDLAGHSNGAPMFTVAKERASGNQVMSLCLEEDNSAMDVQEITAGDKSVDNVAEEDWQIL